MNIQRQTASNLSATAAIVIAILAIILIVVR